MSTALESLVPVLGLVDPDRDADGLSVEDLGSRIVGLAGRIAATTCQWLLLVGAFDAREGCARFGLASTARWLSHCCGLSHRAAVDHVRVARALLAFPQLASAMGSGRLSYSHVRAISRLAKEGEERAVEDLIEVAESGTVSQLETVVRGLRTVEVNDAETPSEEYVRSGWTSSSQWRLGARLDPERGAVVDKALDAVSAAEGITRVEALERIAEIALVVLDKAGRAPRLRGDERAAVVVHLDLDTARAALAPRPADEQPADEQHGVRPAAVWGRLADGPGLPRAVIERLLCSGRLRTQLYRTDGSLFDLGRSQRLVSNKLFRALLARDGGCSHPGCHSRDGLEAHHVRHWLWGGRTDLANLVLLCRRHHHSHHRGEFGIGIAPDATFVFRRPDGLVLERHIDPSRHLAGVHPAGDHLDAAPRWTGTGERLDRHWAIAVLTQRRNNALALAG
jgi:hypothetical protein